MRILRRTLGALCAAALGTMPAAARAAEPAPVALTVYAAGTLAVPFRTIGEMFHRQHPNVTVQAQFAGSVQLARQIADLHQSVDVFAVADSNVIPRYLMGKDGKPGLADWYAGFVGNAITFVYTPRSRFAGEINAQNWYKVLARPGVQIGRSNPDTDPSGYQTLLLLQLASQFYHDPGLEKAVLANAPPANMRDTETSLISVLQAGEIDYLAIYRSDALQHGLKFLPMPDEINLSNPKFAALYAAAHVQTRNGEVTGRPIVYAVTIPTDAAHKAVAEAFVAQLLGPEGQQVMAKAGFEPLKPAIAVGQDRMPPALRRLTAPWPSAH